MSIETMLLFAGANLLITGLTALIATRRASAVAGERWGRLEATLTAIEKQLEVVNTRLNDHAGRIHRQEVSCAGKHGGLRAQEVV